MGRSLKPLWAIMMAIMMIASLSTCFAEEALTELRIGLDNDPTTLDAWNATDTLAMTVMESVYEGLLAVNEAGEIVPVLAAELPEVNEDATAITFKLRQGVKFHDGADFNAEAVAKTIERGLNPDNGLTRRTLIECIETIEIIDEYTIRFNLKYSNATIMASFAHPGCLIMSPNLIDNPDQIPVTMVGTGPYVFKELVDGEHLSVVRNEDYWDKDNMPQFSGITFYPRPEAATRVAGLQTGELDIIYPVSSDQYDILSMDPNLNVMCQDGSLVLFFEMNTQKAPFNDVRVRQAFNYAFNNEAFVKVVENGYGSVPQSCMATALWGFAPQKMYEYNPEKAKELLVEAGYPNGFNCNLFINTTSKSQKMAEFLQQQLAMIGVNLEIKSYEKAVMNEMCSANPEESVHDMRCGGWGPSIKDAHWGLASTLASDKWSNIGGSNYSYYKNDRVDELIALGLSTGNLDERLAIYDEAQRIIVEEAPHIFVDTPGLLWAKNVNIQGVWLESGGQIMYKDAYRVN